jgi:hypothetical protein
VTEITGSTCQAEPVIMPVTAGAVTGNFMIMISRIIVGVMVGLGVTGLTDCVPGGIVFAKGQM